MKTIAAIVLLSCWALAQDKTAISTAESACGPQDAKFEVKSDKAQHPAPAAEEGKALIYFIADGHLTTPIGVDGKWVGAVNGGINGGTYFFVPIEPGERHICAMLQSIPAQKELTRLPRVSVHSLQAEPGGTYYFRARLVGINIGFVLQLDQLDSDEGRWFVAWSSFSNSHPKD